LKLSGIIVIDDVVKEEFNILMQPFEGQVVEKEALAVNKITIADIKKFDRPDAAYDKFVAILSKYVDRMDKKDKFHIFGYNLIAFDVPFLRKFFENNGDPYFNSYVWHPPIDVQNLAGTFLMDVRHQMPNFKQGTAARFLGVQVEGPSHESIVDIRECREMYKKMIG
jgi:DNA polymerase-3 subunit epsilon